LGMIWITKLALGLTYSPSRYCVMLWKILRAEQMFAKKLWIDLGQSAFVIPTSPTYTSTYVNAFHQRYVCFVLSSLLWSRFAVSVCGVVEAPKA
jgi:hypothetical protein